MEKKEHAIMLIKSKINNDSYMSYKDIASVTGYHPKYILKLKKEIIEGIVRIEHGNRNKKSKLSLSDDEINKIINLYKRSHASIRKFCKFYNKRSYSCIYNVLKENELLDNKQKVD